MKKCKIIAALLVFIMIVPAALSGTYAEETETARISVGSGSCDIGDEITISVNVSAVSANTEICMCDIWLNYDSDILQPVSGYDKKTGSSVRILSTESTSFNVKFKAIAAGVSSVSINTSNTIIGSLTEDNLIISAGAGSVTVKAPVSYSTDNTLASLDISPGVLSPAFSPNVTSYTTTVGADCSQLVVSAIANDENASVSIKGTRMDPGSNKTTITVTAQDGSKKVYTISTTKDDSAASDEKNNEKETANHDGQNDVSEEMTLDETELRKVNFNKAEYYISDDFEKNPLPSGYAEIEYEYNGILIKAGKGINTKLILMYLENTDEKGKTGFYVYDSITKSFSLYAEVSQPDITYAILPITDNMEKPDGYKKTTYSIAGYEADVLMDTDGRYCLFYGVSSSGSTGWFCYDCNDGTIQSYNTRSSQVVSMENQEEIKAAAAGADKSWKAAAFVLICVSAVFMIITAVLAVKLSKSRRAFEMAADSGYDYDDEEDPYDFDSYEEDDDEELENDVLKEDDVVNSITEALSKNEDTFEFLDIQDVDDIERK